MARNSTARFFSPAFLQPQIINMPLKKQNQNDGLENRSVCPSHGIQTLGHIPLFIYLFFVIKPRTGWFEGARVLSQPLSYSDEYDFQVRIIDMV